MSKVRRIYVCQPGYASGIPASHRQFWIGACKPGSPYQGKLDLVSHGGSLLAMTFNQFWANALSLQEALGHITHFAMLHDDIVPDDGWLDTLMEDLLATGAIMMSALVPIKDPQGLTSTAIGNRKTNFEVLRRLTMYEAMRLPPVFDVSDCGYPDHLLLANSGCWVCDLTHPMFHERDLAGNLKILFTINDRVKWVEGGLFTLVLPDESPATSIAFDSRNKAEMFRSTSGNDSWKVKEHGRYVVNVESEDWYFSRKIGEAGGKVMVTKRVGLSHVGQLPYSNRGDWGEWQYDKVFGKNCNERPILDPGYVDSESIKEQTIQHTEMIEAKHQTMEMQCQAK